MRDPSSWLCAARSEWQFPVSREFTVLAHSYDLLARVNSKQKPKPYPTPWENANKTKLGSKKSQTRDSVLGILDRMNPKES